MPQPFSGAPDARCSSSSTSSIDQRAARSMASSSSQATGAATGAPVFDLAPFLCRGGRCPAAIGDLPLYRDDVHFSVEGARQLGERTGLASKLIEMAR